MGSDNWNGADMKKVVFPDRGLITVSGEDRIGFLQGLVSADVRKASDGQAVWSALLTPQGKYMFDFFIVPEGERLLLECARDRMMELGQTLRRHVLRSKVQLGIDERFVEGYFGGDAYERFGLTEDSREVVSQDGRLAFVDPRFAGLGVRAFVPEKSEEDPSARLLYEKLRIANAIPDSTKDMIPGKSLLLECGFDELDGVDWKKGCYMGQELTARTKYRGLIKKRLLPVFYEGDAIRHGEFVKSGEKEVGEVMSAVEGCALALVRLDSYFATVENDDRLQCADKEVRILIPEWIRTGIEGRAA